MKGPMFLLTSLIYNRSDIQRKRTQYLGSEIVRSLAARDTVVVSHCREESADTRYQALLFPLQRLV